MLIISFQQSEILNKLKKLRCITNREIYGKDPGFSYRYTIDDVNIFKKEIQNIINEKSCTIMK